MSRVRLYPPRLPAGYVAFGAKPGSSGPAPNDFPVIAGLTLRLESDLGVTSASNLVSKWDDQKQGISFTAAGAARPTLVAAQVNGSPAVRWNGSANKMESNSLLSDLLTGAHPSTFKVVAILKNNSAATHSGNSYDEPAILCDAGSFWSPVAGDNTYIDGGFYQGPDHEAKVAQATGALVYTETTLITAAGGTLTVQVGTTGTPDTKTNVGTIGGVTGFLKLGRNYADAAFWQGDLFAIYVATSMTAPELTALRTYLKTKYGSGL